MMFSSHCIPRQYMMFSSHCIPRQYMMFSKHITICIYCVTMINCCYVAMLLNYWLSGVLLYFQGNVYVKCMTPQVAAAAFNSLNGRFFAGK